MSCRWDKDAEDYLLDDGTPCRYDEHGDRTNHCTARRSCRGHVGPRELTCARCLGRARMDIRAIPGLAALMLPMSLGGSVDSEAVNLDGPAADPEAWSWRKVAARKGGTWHVSLEEDDDERHPFGVLSRWVWMLSEDYNGERTVPESTKDAADYLDRVLSRVAQDDEQDFPLLAREVRKVRRHLDSVLRNSHEPVRGAPCPDCADAQPDKPAPRLAREWGHWCDAAECERVHYHDDSGDLWVCPRDRTHWRTVAEYEAYLTERSAG